MPTLTRCLSVACLCLLAGCATDAQHGRTRIVAPSEISAAYSEVEMQARLAFTQNVVCEAHACASVEEFRERVKHIGERVTDAAYQLAFDLDIQTPVSFNVEVPGKDDIGTLSSGTGNIIVFDGLRELELDDPAMAFLVAREMGHVLARHHDENSATSIGISIAVAVVFPMANVLRGVEAAYATASTAGLASTAVSMAGSRIVRSMYKGEQQREADALALRILEFTGWTPHDVAAGLERALPQLSSEGWMADLLETMAWLEAITMGPQLPPIQPLPALQLTMLDPATPPHDLVVDTEPPPVLMAVALFAPPPADRIGGPLRLVGAFHAPWGEALACRARLPAGVVLPGGLPVQEGGDVPKSARPLPSATRLGISCIKKGKRTLCSKPLIKKTPRQPLKKALKPGVRQGGVRATRQSR